MLASNIKEKRYNRLLYIVIFLVIIVDTSFYTVNNIDGFIRVAVDMIAALIIPLYKRKIQIDRNSALICAYSVAVIIINGLVFGSVKQTIILSAFIVAAYIIRSTIDQEEFIEKYCNILLFLAVFSLVVFLIYLIAPNAIRMLPSLTRGNAGNNYYNAIFSVVNYNPYVKRNFGLFWEPGAFAIFLNIALFFELFCRKQDLRRLVVLTITVLTTLSTTGIVCMMILYVAGLFKNNNNINKYLKAFIVLFFVIGIIYILYDGDYFINHVFGKLSGIYSGTTIQTTSVRVNSITYPGREFLKSILWGIGFNNFLVIQDQYCLGMATCTFVNWLAIYGILGGLIPIVGVVRFFVQKGENYIIKILAVLFSFLLFSTENFVQIFIIYLFFLYGITRIRKYE